MAASSKGGTRSALELLPWMVPVSDGLVICKDGGLLACYEITGLDLDGTEEARQVELAAAADRFMDAFKDRPVTLWWTVHRQRTAEYPGGTFPSFVARMLDEDNRASFEAEGNFRNRHFVSVLWRPGDGSVSVLDRISNFIGEGVNPLRAVFEGAKAAWLNRNAFAFRAAEIDLALREFEPILERAEGSLFPSAPRRLRGKELLGFLWACSNPGAPMTPKAWDGASLLDGFLPERPITVNPDTLTFGDGEDALHAAAISLKSPPAEGTAFASFSGLLALPCELTLSLCFRVMPTKEAESHLSVQRRLNEVMRFPVTAYIAGAIRGGQMNEAKADPARTAAMNEVIEAREAMAETYYGWTNVTLVLYNEDQEALGDIVRETLRVLYAGTYVGAVRESIHLVSGWATTLPGQWEECRRWLVMSARNAVDLSPLVGVSDGEISNDYLSRQLSHKEPYKAPCLTALTTEYRTPYYFNLHAEGLGHALVLGPSGSGKSVGMNFLISQWGRYPRSRALIFDKDYSCKIATLAQGGTHIDLKPETRIALNPIALVKNPAHRSFVASWVQGLISAKGYVITTQDSEAISRAVSEVAARFETHLIRLSALAVLLPSHLRDELRPWCYPLNASPGEKPGQFAEYFDNVDDALSLDGHMTTIEMNEVMKQPEVARAFLDYAFYRLNMLLNEPGQGEVFPTLIYVEEAWFLMQDEAFVKRLMDWLRTFRKKTASVVLATQSLEDVAMMPPRVVASLRDNIKTRIFLPNPTALSDSAYPMYRNAMGLTDVQINRIAHATPREDYFIVKPNVARMVKLRLNARQLTVLRSDQKALRTFDRHYSPDEPVESWVPPYITELMEASR